MNEEGLKPDSESIDVLLSLADLYLKNNLFDEAEDLLKTAIEDNREVVQPYITLAKLYVDKDEKDRALEVLKKAEKIAPENEDVKGLLESLEVETEKSVEVSEEERRESDEIEVEDLDDLFDRLMADNSILGVIISDESGALIKSEINLPLNEESTTAIINSIYNKVEDASEQLGMGEVRKAYFDLPGGKITVLGTSLIRFMVITRKDIIISNMTPEIKGAFKKVLEILGV